MLNKSTNPVGTNNFMPLYCASLTKSYHAVFPKTLYFNFTNGILVFSKVFYGKHTLKVVGNEN
jgi:hypothetical protein